MKHEDEQIETISRHQNEKGQDVWVFKQGKYNVKVTYLNDLSPEAIKNANRTYNELFDKFNPQPARE